LLDISGPHDPQEFYEAYGEPVAPISEADLLRLLSDFMRSQTLNGLAEAERIIDRYLKPKFPHLYPQSKVISERAQIPLDNPKFRAWFGNSKVVDEAGKPLVVYHGSGSNFTSFDPSRVRFKEDGVAFFFTDNRGTADAYVSDDGEVMEVYLSLQNPLILMADENESAIEKWDYSDGEVRARADKEGRDGVIIRGRGHDEDLFVAFRPNQIKSIANKGGYNPDADNISEDVQ
jgi:hypothetical protein